MAPRTSLPQTIEIRLPHQHIVACMAKLHTRLAFVEVNIVRELVDLVSRWLCNSAYPVFVFVSRFVTLTSFVPGYTLNRAALKLLVVDSQFGRGTVSHLMTSAEDALVGGILRTYGVHPYRTTDRDNGARYHHFPPYRHYVGGEPPFYHKFTKSLNYTRGTNHSSVYSVAFHYIKPEEMRQDHAMLYGLCRSISPTVLTQRTQSSF